MRRLSSIISTYIADNNTDNTENIAIYIYQQKDWPYFTWDNSEITPLLTNVRHNQRCMLGKMEGLGFGL